MARPARNKKSHKPATVAAAPGLDGRTILDWLLLGLCLLILALRATVVESPTAQGSALPGETGDAVYTLTLSGLLILALLCRIIDTALSGRWTCRRGGFEFGLAVFIVGALTAGMFASDKRAAITGALTLIAPAAMAATLLQVLTTRRRIMILLCTMAGLAAANAYQGLGQYLLSNEETIRQYEQDPQMFLEPLGIEPGSFQQFMFEHRLYSRGVRGFFTTRNTAGCYLMLSLFPACILLVDRWRKRAGQSRYLVAAGIVTAAMAICLLLTRSKGAILGLLAAAALMVLLLRYCDWIYKHRRRLLIAVILIAALGAASVAAHGLAYGSLPGGNSMLVRWQYWHAAGRMYLDHPMGVGAGNFGTFYTHYKPAAAVESVADPHNFFLSILTQYGPIGLLGFMLMLLGPLWRSLAAAAQDYADPAEPPSRAAGMSALFVAFGLVVLRPLLLPVQTGTDPVVVIYIVVVMYIAPAAAFVIGMISFAGPVGRRSGTSTATGLKMVSISLFCAVIAVLIQNLIDFALFEPGVYTGVWALIACVAACRYVSGSVTAAERTLPPYARSAIAAICVVSAVGLLVFCYMPVYRSQAKIAAANTALSAGREDLAHAALTAAVDEDPLSDEALDMLAKLYIRRHARSDADQSPLARAAEYLNLAIERNPANYKTRERLARVYESMGNTADALEAIEGAVETYPGSGRIHLIMARLLEEDSPARALEHYRLAVAIEDAFADQFSRMYPDRDLVSRIGRTDYDFAKKRIEALSSRSDL